MSFCSCFAWAIALQISWTSSAEIASSEGSGIVANVMVGILAEMLDRDGG